MHHYNSVVSLQITICNDIDGEHNYGATLQSCRVVQLGVTLLSFQLSLLYFIPLIVNDAQLNGSPYLKKENSLGKWSKCAKISRYVEQILGKIHGVSVHPLC